MITTSLLTYDSVINPGLPHTRLTISYHRTADWYSTVSPFRRNKVLIAFQRCLYPIPRNVAQIAARQQRRSKFYSSLRPSLRLNEWLLFYQSREPMRYGIACDRGQGRPSVSAGLRELTAQKLNCPWALERCCKRIEGQQLAWTFRIRHGEHNPDTSSDPSAHTIHRRIMAAQQRSLADLSKRNNIRPVGVYNYSRLL
jgi:hypothetical protein